MCATKNYFNLVSEFLSFNCHVNTRDRDYDRFP